MILKTPDILLKVSMVPEKDRSNYTNILLWAVYLHHLFWLPPSIGDYDSVPLKLRPRISLTRGRRAFHSTPHRTRHWCL